MTGNQNSGAPTAKDRERNRLYLLLFMTDNYEGISGANITKKFTNVIGITNQNSSLIPKRLQKEGFLIGDKYEWKLKTDLITFRRIYQELDSAKYVDRVKLKMQFSISKYFEFMLQFHSSFFFGRLSDHLFEDDYDLLKVILALSPSALKIVLNENLLELLDRSIFTKYHLTADDKFIKNFLDNFMLIRKEVKLGNKPLMQFFMNCMVVDYFSSRTYQKYIESLRDLYAERHESLSESKEKEKKYHHNLDEYKNVIVLDFEELRSKMKEKYSDYFTDEQRNKYGKKR